MASAPATLTHLPGRENESELHVGSGREESSNSQLYFSLFLIEASFLFVNSSKHSPYVFSTFTYVSVYI